jgi:pilin/secretion family protein with methylation motif
VSERKARRSEAGFTLAEVLVSIVILVFGLIAVTNLLIVAGTSSQVANTGTTAAAIAFEQMETLKALPFPPAPNPGLQFPGPVLAPGGSLTVDTPGFFRNSTTDPRLRVPGGGAITVRWQVIWPVAGQSQLAWIAVRAESRDVFFVRTRSDYTAFRACTGPVADQGGCRNNATVDDRPCCPTAP